MQAALSNCAVPTHDGAYPTAKPMVVSTAAVRMSVPVVPAQTMKQVTWVSKFIQRELSLKCPLSYIHGFYSP